MAVIVEWFGVAEASAEDSRGATSLIGVNRNIIVTENLPITRNKAVILLLRESESPETILVAGTKIAVDLSVVDPDGNTMISARHGVELGEKPYPDLPGGVSVVANLQLAYPEYGTYLFQASVEVPDGVVTAEKTVHVVSPEPLTTPA